MDYQDFLAAKTQVEVPTGLEVENVNSKLFDYQQDIVKWALRRGRAAIFADCGMGKTAMQLEWSHHVAKNTGRPVLILAPLAVSSQTVEEGVKFGIDVTMANSENDIMSDGIYITNYEKMHRFDLSVFSGVVLDESSILKSFTGKYRNDIIEGFAITPFKLACTATPAPNDHTELGNHAEFLGIMARHEMLATYFVHDAGDTGEWRLKGHAVDEYWRWVASWAISISHPNDLGYEANQFVLPELKIIEHILPVDHCDSDSGQLFRTVAVGLGELRNEQRKTVRIRAEKVAQLVNESKETWIVWCNRNDESEELCRLIPDAVSVSGSDSNEQKVERMLGFSSGTIRVLVTKPSIAGFGMNWQHCNNVAFVGLSHSYEQFYQAVRRCWRFGQKNEVSCHVVVAETEYSVLQSIKRKQADAKEMNEQMVSVMKDITISAVRGASMIEKDEYRTEIVSGNGWTLHLGDCVDVARTIESETVDVSIFSPPFSSLFTYSNSIRDMGNSKDDNQFFTHFGFLIDELFRVIKLGRLCIVHCMQLTTSKSKDGFVGLRDFRGEIIREFVKRDFIYHSEVCIWKDPVVSMQRTKAHGLLYKTLRKDAARSRQGLADYLVIFRKDGNNPKPIENTIDTFTLDDWQNYASPVWSDINQTNVLNNYRDAREHNDERHVCPLQLDVIERALKLWSAEDDLVFSPFTGIGSEGYQALKMGRRFIGAELKKSYFDQAVHNLDRASKPSDQILLF
jgi:superfamily II DNA or RNA helicase